MWTSTPTISPGIVNSSAENTLASGTIAAASIAAGDVLVFEAYWDALQNVGTQTYTYRLKIGGTTVFTSGAISPAQSSSRYRIEFRAVINIASTSDQRCKAEVTDWGTNGLLAGSRSLANVGTAAEDLTSDKTLALTVQMNTANASMDARLYGASLVRMR